MFVTGDCNSERSCELGISLDWFSKRRPGNLKVSGAILGKIKKQKQHKTFYVVPGIRT